MLIDRPKSADVGGGLPRPASDPAARTWWHWACDRAGSARGGGGGRAPPNTPRTTPPPPPHRTEPTITYLISLLKSCSVIGDYEWLGFPPIPSPSFPATSAAIFYFIKSGLIPRLKVAVSFLSGSVSLVGCLLGLIRCFYSTMSIL